MSQLMHTDGVIDLAPAPARSTGWALVADLSTLTKPRITLMVVLTAYIGYAMGKHALIEGEVIPGWLTLIATLVGTGCSCMGASIFNQVYERDTDAKMHRTMNRPIPAGRVGIGPALVLGLVLAVSGVTLLAVLASPLAAAISAFTMVSYTFIYTPMKRVSSTSTIIGALPGALPPVIGYAAAAGRIGPAAVLLFAIMFMWQLPHFLAIAWLYREDYARAGFPMLPVIDPHGDSTFRQILIGCLTLLPLGLMPTAMGISGVVYFTGALVAGLGFLAFGVWLVIGRQRRHARAMFFASLVYLPVVFALMLIDRV